MTNLRYSLQGAQVDCNENRHAQVVMKELGITYQHATPQSICDQWWFWNCENVPNPLPPFLELLNVTPEMAIGIGLSKEDADRITAPNTSLQVRGARAAGDTSPASDC